MARISIEDCWWTDPRRSKLIKLLGDEYRADGAAVRMWRLAQEYWKANRGLVPKQIFDCLDCAGILLESGLAEERENELVYVRGSSEYLEWIAAWTTNRQKAGRKSAQRPRDSEGRLLATFDQQQALLTSDIHTLTSDSQKRARGSRDTLGKMLPKAANGPTGVQQTSNTSNSSSSSSSSYVNTNTNTLKANSRKNRESPPEGIGQFIATYAAAWKTRYGSRPDLRGKVQGQIKTFLKDTSLERACELIQIYVQMDDPWFVKKCHDFGTFLENIGKVNIALDTGQMPPDSLKTEPDPFAFFKKLEVVSS